MINSLSDWKKQCPGSYNTALGLGFQREIAEILGWSIQESDSSGKKAELLELARSGADRPSYRTKLGMALSSYTRPKNSGSYDPEFTKQIKELRPDWFTNTAELKKAKLLELARSGADKPSHKTKLGQALVNHSTKNSRFGKQIKELRPDWFTNSAELKKTELLELARSGADRPSHKTKLGMSLNSYIRPKNNAYDPEFTKQIKELRPDWFRNRSPL